MTEPTRRKIEHKIVKVEVVTPHDTDASTAATQPYGRPYVIKGSTYKLKPPTMNAALYVTINHIELPDGLIRPFEIFLNTKDISSTQWMVAVTRLLSGIFRSHIPFEFAIAELRDVFDPKGSYFHGNKLLGGIVPHIAEVIEQHCIDIGAIKKTDAPIKIPTDSVTITNVPMRECHKCHQKALVQMDGCWTCTACGESKCD